MMRPVYFVYHTEKSTDFRSLPGRPGPRAANRRVESNLHKNRHDQLESPSD